MNDFEKLIRQELEKGVSAEDIAKQFTNALNEHNEIENGRRKILDNLEKVLLIHFQEQRFVIGDAAAILTLLVSKDAIGKDWDGQKLDKFRKFAQNVIKTIPKEFDLFEKISGEADKVGNGLEGMINKIMETIVKSGFNGPSNTDSSRGESCEIPKPKSDEESIADFLKDLFN